MTYTNINMVRGDTLSFGIEYDGTEQDLEDAFFTCRNNVNSENYIFQKTIGNGISRESTGKYIIRVAPEDTQNIDAGSYYYDFEVRLNGDVFTLLIGSLIIEQDYTNN